MYVLGSLSKSLCQGNWRRTQLLKQGYEMEDWSKRKNKVPDSLALGQKQGKSGGRGKWLQSFNQNSLNWPQVPVLPRAMVLSMGGKSEVNDFFKKHLRYLQYHFPVPVGERKTFSATLSDSVPGAYKLWRSDKTKDKELGIQAWGIVGMYIHGRN